MANIFNVGVLGSDEDVMARKAQESIAAAILGEVEGLTLVEMRRPRAGVRGLTTSTSGSRSPTGS